MKTGSMYGTTCMGFSSRQTLTLGHLCANVYMGFSPNDSWYLWFNSVSPHTGI